MAEGKQNETIFTPWPSIAQPDPKLRVF